METPRQTFEGQIKHAMAQGNISTSWVMTALDELLESIAVEVEQVVDDPHCDAGCPDCAMLEIVTGIIRANKSQ